MLDDFLVRAAIAGIGVAIASGALGCFIIWRRMAYFGDATAHAAILGVALALAFSLPITVGALLVALLLAITVVMLSGRSFTPDTLLGVLAHSTLAFGLVATSLLANVNLNLESFLFGDILAVNKLDLAYIWGGTSLVVALLAYRWQALLTATLNPDLAQASGISPLREQMVLTITLALVVAVAIKVVGVLLIASMLIIPAATARPLVRSPEAMAVMATLVGTMSVLFGLSGSYLWDTPTGPTIVCAAAVLFALSSTAAALRRKL